MTWRGPLMALVMAAAALTTVPSGTAQTEPGPLYEITDPAGDVEVAAFGFGGGQMPVSAPRTAATDPYDILAFRILEDTPDRLVLELEIADLMAAGSALDRSQLSGLSGPHYQIFFQLAGSPIEYRIDRIGWYTGQCGTAIFFDCDIQMPAALCIITPNTSCYRQPVYTDTDFENSRILLYVPKASLLGKAPMENFSSSGQLPAGIPKNLPAGTPLQGWRVVYRNNWFFDQAPDAGTGDAYRLATPSANTRIAVRLTGEHVQAPNPYTPFSTQGDGVAEVGAAPGVPTVVPLRVLNTADGKRLVNLTVDLLEGDASAWSFRIVPSLAMPDGAQRDINLVINASSGVRHGDTASLLVKAQAIGHPQEIGVLRLKVKGSVPPGPDAPRLHFHSDVSASATDLFFFGRRGQTWLNTLEEDPAGTADADGYAPYFLFPLSSWQDFAIMDTPLVTDLVLDTSKPVTSTLRFSSTVAYEAEAELRVFAGDVFLGSATAAGTVGTQPSDFSFTIPVPEDHRRISKDAGGIGAQIILRNNDIRGGGFGDGVRMHPRGSHIELPLVPDPDAPSFDVALGPARLGLSYNGEGKPEEFVNPNRTKLFELVLINEGVVADTFKLNLTFVEDVGWRVAVAPSLSYRIGPGESVTFGVFVSAPRNASEGEQFHVRVQAVSTRDNATRTTMTLVAIATNGVDIPDEVDAYRADNDTISRAVDERGGTSPGAPAALVVGALGAAAAAARQGRRKTL